MEHDGDNYTNRVAVNKRLLKGLNDFKIEGRVETIQTTTLLRTARILRRALNRLNRLTIAQIPVKDHRLTLIQNSQGVNNNKTTK